MGFKPCFISELFTDFVIPSAITLSENDPKISLMLLCSLTNIKRLAISFLIANSQLSPSVRGIHTTGGLSLGILKD